MLHLAPKCISSGSIFFFSSQRWWWCGAAGFVLFKAALLLVMLLLGGEISFKSSNTENCIGFSVFSHREFSFTSMFVVFAFVFPPYLVFMSGRDKLRFMCDDVRVLIDDEKFTIEFCRIRTWTWRKFPEHGIKVFFYVPEKILNENFREREKYGKWDDPYSNMNSKNKKNVSLKDSQ